MPLPPYDLELLDAALSHAAFGLGEAADADEAFDHAAAATTTSPAFAAADPGLMEVVREGLSIDQAVVASLSWLADNPDSSAVAAFGIVGRSEHARKTRRIRLDDPALEPDLTAAGRWTHPDGPLLAALEASEGWDLGDGEEFENVTLTRRARYKPVVQVNKGKTAAQHIAVTGDLIVTRGHATAGLARKEAVRLLKERDADDHELAELEVFKLSGREESRPLISIRRTRISQVVTAKLVHATVKPGKQLKTVGWLFVTHV